MDVKIVNNDLKFKFRVSAIIINNNEVLLEKYENDKYCLPGGYVELNETTEDAIKRELLEETKLKFSIDKFCGAIENFFVNKRGVYTHEIDFYYYLKCVDKIENLKMDLVEKGSYSDIHHNLKWISLDKLNECNLLPNELKDIIINNKQNIHIILKD